MISHKWFLAILILVGASIGWGVGGMIGAMVAGFRGMLYCGIGGMIPGIIFLATWFYWLGWNPLVAEEEVREKERRAAA